MFNPKNWGEFNSFCTVICASATSKINKSTTVITELIIVLNFPNSSNLKGNIFPFDSAKVFSLEISNRLKKINSERKNKTIKLKI